MGIELRIEELVLHGFARADSRRIAREVERELARLIGQGSFPVARENLNLEKIDAGAFTLEQGPQAPTAGTQIAKSLYRSLRQQARPSRNRPAAGGRRP
jgi:hypothetical protein